MGPTRVSKLLARKRPHLLPILDSRVREFYGDTSEFWAPLAAALRDANRRTAIDALVPNREERGLSLLRVLDIAIWMSGRQVPGQVTEGDEHF